MKFYIINGPNLNLLGMREPDIYGHDTYESLCAYVQAQAAAMGHETAFFQSNHEGAIVDAIQAAKGVYDAIVINPAAYTHTSIAILDALKAVALPAAEVHISDVTQREAYRQISYVSAACCCRFIGQGIEGYVNAIKALAERE
ncbi:MAG: 3-dehydroquinate dehydratase [Oscillospiraceae bacterium]|jgi:3-dehydroquinate dehydratase-2|nr:3-dehydroquinate dehydratase [Oscillospiraceae bacterium]